MRTKNHRTPKSHLSSRMWIKIEVLLLGGQDILDILQMEERCACEYIGAMLHNDSTQLKIRWARLGYCLTTSLDDREIRQSVALLFGTSCLALKALAARVDGFEPKKPSVFLVWNVESVFLSRSWLIHRFLTKSGPKWFWENYLDAFTGR